MGATFPAPTQTRVQGATGDQTLKATPGSFVRILASNGDGSAQTVTFKDDSTTKWVLRLAAGESIELDLGIVCATSVVVTPSDTDVDCFITYA